MIVRVSTNSSVRFSPASNWPKEPSLNANEEYGTAYAGGLQEAVRLLKVEQAKMSSFDKKLLLGW